jgi:hypothetical protein
MIPILQRSPLCGEKRPCHRRWVLIAAALLLLGFTLPAVAQRFVASIRGAITDEGGNEVEGALVTVTNVGTGLARSTTTNPAGSYLFGDLPVGSYSLEVTLEGYRSVAVTGIELNVAAQREIDARLLEGGIEDEITVTAPAMVVETIGGEVAGLVTGEQARELPLNGRNFLQLTQLMPGVSAPDYYETKNKGLLTSAGLSVSGGLTTGNLWTVDGANNNDVGSNQMILVYPSVEAIEEFKIHRNSYGAEFGGAGGAHVNLVTRGGTNELKGSVFYFARRDDWNETNFILPAIPWAVPSRRTSCTSSSPRSGTTRSVAWLGAPSFPRPPRRSATSAGRIPLVPRYRSIRSPAAPSPAT